MKNSGEYIFGRNAVTEALNSDSGIEKIYLSFNAHGSNINRIYSLAKKNRVPVTKFDKRKFSDLEKKAGISGNSQGVIALISQVTTLSLDELLSFAKETEKYPVIVALDGITDPQNLGAISRSVECSGASGIILPVRESAPITSTAVKTSAGAINHIKISKVNNLAYALEKCKDEGFWIAGTDMDSDKNYTDKIYDSPLIIVIGSEGKGLKPVIRKNCDFLVRIPMKGKIESLNASVSAGIILFERLRQIESDL